MPRARQGQVSPGCEDPGVRQGPPPPTPGLCCPPAHQTPLALNPERYPVTSDLSQDTRGLPAQRGGYLSLAQISLMLAPALTLSDFLFLAV